MRPEYHWTYRANCLNENINLFYSNAPESVEKAKQICANCVVRIECYIDNEYVERKQYINGSKFSYQLHGIFAGETPEERRQRRARLNGGSIKN